MIQDHVIALKGGRRDIQELHSKSLSAIANPPPHSAFQGRGDVPRVSLEGLGELPFQVPDPVSHPVPDPKSL